MEEGGDDESPPPPAAPGWAVDELCGAWNLSCQEPPQAVEFQGCHEPPGLPKTPFFELLPTCVRLRGLAAEKDAREAEEKEEEVPHWMSCLGNDLVDFLRAGLPSRQAVKVRPEKFTAKAEVGHDGARCTVKLRAYLLDDGAIAVEAQRRSGDVVFFMNIFRALVRFLELRYRSELRSSCCGSCREGYGA